MVALKTRFDGQQIVLPPELRGSAPREVVIVVENPLAEAPAPADPRPSIWDVVGKALRLRTAEDIDRQIREERESWGDR
ncbi:MAG: hypothetical protein JWO31_374 [Phycisphaerales bacterium]|nr:hypothetical protein [Phycisphaerales bacterium]